MRLCPTARGLTIITLPLVVGYAYLLEVRAPCWPVWPIEWRTVAELDFLVCIILSLIAVIIAAHCSDSGR